MKKAPGFAKSFCGPVGIRTPNLLIRSQMLYPIELRVLCAFLRVFLPGNSNCAGDTLRAQTVLTLLHFDPSPLR